MEKQSNSSLDIQVGGTRYKDMKMQPIEFIAKLNLDFFQGNFVKYISRYKNKNGKQDLKKCLHYIDLRSELVGNYLETDEVSAILTRTEDYCKLNNLSQYVEQAILMYLLNRYNKAKDIVQLLINEEYGTEQ